MAGCASSQARDDSDSLFSQSLPDDARVFQVKGVVKKLLPDQNTVVIDHEEIPGYMDAMTMPFDVKDPSELEGLSPNDQVSFRMIITDEDGWIDQVTRLGGTHPVENSQIPSVRIVREVEPLNVGDPMMDYSLTNQFGKTFKLSDFQGKAYAITFIFTRCPFPDFCPRMANHFHTVQEALKADPGAPRNWRLLSLSFDPGHDTPEVLESYAKTHQYDPNWWTWATGAMVDIDAITEQFGLRIARQGDTFNHTLRTVVIDAAGKVHHVFIGNTWTPEQLIEQIKQAAAVKNG